MACGGDPRWLSSARCSTRPALWGWGVRALCDRGPEARRLVGSFGPCARPHPESDCAPARADASDGIIKSNGRIEATQVDVSSKYAGRLAEVTVEEGSSVTQGQVIAKLTSPIRRPVPAPPRPTCKRQMTRSLRLKRK